MIDFHGTQYTASARSALAKRIRNLLVASGVVGVTLLGGSPAHAASLQNVEQSVWWQDVTGLPSYVNMYLYVPDQLIASPPIVVAPHHCQGTGPGTFSEMSSLVTLADQKGYIMIFPEATGQNCWDAGSDRSLQHDGKGDTHAIAQMVRYTLETYGGNADRVYSVGGSSGAIMTEALLGVYPDIFMAGVSLMGVPCGCWAEGYNDVVGNPSNGTGQWSGACAGGNVKKSGQEWGDLVRSFFPDYSGHRPRLQHWHGTADTVLNYSNMEEDIKQWTNLLELSESPDGSDTPANGTTRQFWTNACGFTVYETFSLSGVGHSVPFDGSAVAEYFGLNDSEGLDPEAAACPETGDTGMGGASTTTSTGAAGATSSSAGGVGGAGASTVGMGGAGTQGTSSTDGPTATGDSSSTGTSDTATTGGTPATNTTTGTTVSGATSTVGTGGMSSTTAGSTGGLEGDSGSTGPVPVNDSSDEGCSCRVVGHGPNSNPGALALLIATLGVALLRRGKRSRLEQFESLE